ncbi:hypothetical protein [Pseudomonas sp. MWU12-3103b]|uniref:hypothetical protein n=1 Tax=Pseudomonas sp. MWU12-3103b TaxID=2928857 RepID=UPI001FFFC990|nr:hypothetical protein [Pseudomonas sp. MWU12-3103b]
MALMVGSPPPESVSGASGDQQPGSTGNVAPTPPPLLPDQLPRVLMTVIAESPEFFGGPQLAPVMSAMIGDASVEKAQARTAVDAIQLKLDSKIAEFSDLKEQYARLEERLEGAETLGTQQKYCTFFGTAAVGFAIELYKSQYKIPAVLLGLLGIGLLLMNLKRGKKS